MTESYSKRYIKKCEEFTLCAELGGRDLIGIERSKSRYTLYQYFIHGSASFYELSDGGIVSRTIGKEKQLVDVKKYFNKNSMNDNIKFTWSSQHQTLMNVING